ncbi:hypothetical protein GQ600_7599 [Phytophthora cactorum]|nr:hypothetical protein GQ600_7599 [Phytophthora cactorum]
MTSIFSGHYQCYGVNVQACDDHHCRFTAIATKCPEGMGDALRHVGAIAELKAEGGASELDSSVDPCDFSVYRRLYRSTQTDPEPTVESDLVRSTIVYKLGSNNHSVLNTTSDAAC